MRALLPFAIPLLSIRSTTGAVKATIMKKDGKESKKSITLPIDESTLPLKYPAVTPINNPINNVMKVAIKVTKKEILDP